MERVRTIEDYWPVVLRLFPAKVADQEIDRWLHEDCARILARRERYLVINDLEQGTTTSVQRRMIAKWIASNTHMLNQYRIATGSVVSSSLLKGIVTAIFWVTPPPYRHETFSRVDDAVEWANGEIANAGLTVIRPLKAWR